MDPENGLKSVKTELPLVVHTLQPKKTRSYHRRIVAAGVLIGAVLLFVHKQHPFVPEPWLEGHPDHHEFHNPGSPTGKEAEEIFL